MKTIADRVIEVIEDSGMSRSAFAASVNMSPSYISKLAKNEVVQPSRNFIQVVCDKYNVNEEWLISGSGKKNKSLSYEDEIAEIAKALFDDKENDFRIRLTRSIAKMDTKQLKMVEKYLNALLKEEEDENNGMS